MNAGLINHGLTSSPPDHGELRAEFRALTTEAGVYQLRERAKVALTGNDRTRWLNGVVTNNVRDLLPTHGVYAFLLNPQGHILGDLYTYNRGNALLLDTELAQLARVLAHFDHYIIMDDVEVANVSEKLGAIGVAGPRSIDVLKNAGIEVPELVPLQSADLVWQDIGLTVIRGDNPVVLNFELWLGPSNLAVLQEKLVEGGATSVGSVAVELLRVASGVPRYGQDIRERDLPQETQQERALNFAKGCYIGQEIVERIRSRGNVHRKFTGLLVDGPLPSPGTKVQVESKDVGEITSAASLPVGDAECLVALGYVRNEAAAGKQLRAGESTLRAIKVPLEGILRQ